MRWAGAMSIRDDIVATFRQVADAQGKTLAPLSDDLRLSESGLDSLSFALVVTFLEDSLKIDPFNAVEAGDFPVTLGDFIKLYARGA
jgi:acyl carrier protein